MKDVATIILNRNLPEPTNRLFAQISKYNNDLTDIFILESGSDESLLSQNYTWHVNTPEVKKEGLRYCRGMNYALQKYMKTINHQIINFFY